MAQVMQMDTRVDPMMAKLSAANDINHLDKEVLDKICRIREYISEIRNKPDKGFFDESSIRDAEEGIRKLKSGEWTPDMVHDNGTMRFKYRSFSGKIVDLCGIAFIFVLFLGITSPVAFMVIDYFGVNGVKHLVDGFGYVEILNSPVGFIALGVAITTPKYFVFGSVVSLAVVTFFGGFYWLRDINFWRFWLIAVFVVIFYSILFEFAVRVGLWHI